MTYEQLTNKYAPITLKMIIGDIVKRSLRYTGPIGKAVILYNKKKSIEKYKECIFNCNKRFKNLWLQFFLSQNQGFMRLFEKTVLK